MPRITPNLSGSLLHDPDQSRIDSAMQAMFGMRKLDIAALPGEMLLPP